MCFLLNQAKLQCDSESSPLKTVAVTKKPVVTEKTIVNDDTDAEKYYPKLPALYVGDKKFNYGFGVKTAAFLIKLI